MSDRVLEDASSHVVDKVSGYYGIKVLNNLTTESSEVRYKGGEV